MWKHIAQIAVGVGIGLFGRSWLTRGVSTEDLVLAGLLLILGGVVFLVGVVAIGVRSALVGLGVRDLEEGLFMRPRDSEGVLPRPWRVGDPVEVVRGSEPR